MYYGAIDKEEIRKIVFVICKHFRDVENAEKLILGTIAVETDFATTRDNTKESGAGLTQIDKIAFEDIKKRTKTAVKAMIYKEFDIHIDDIVYDSLKHSPFLSILFSRLFYLLIPEKIPDTIQKQAEYWKKYYNTANGKGNTETYIKKYAKFVLVL